MTNILINLLPPEKKQEIKDIKFTRTILKIGLMAVCALIVFVIFMQFCIQAVGIQKKVVEKQSERLKENNAYLTVQSSKEKLRGYNKKARQVRRELNEQNDYWKIITEINSFVPTGISLKELMIKGNKLVLRGEADHRQAVLDLQQELEKNSSFKKIESPISNFVAEKGINFEFKALIKNENKK